MLPAGPIEGALGRDVLPGWMLDELRRRGVPVTDDPVVLDRRKLGGVVPGADVVGAALCVLFGGTLSVCSLGASLVWRHQRRRLLRSLAAAPRPVA